MLLPLKKIYFYLRILLFAIYLINGILAIPRNSVVYDEMDRWSYSKRVLKGQPEIIYPYDDAGISPFHVFNALPRAAEQVLSPGLTKSDGGFSDIMHGRYVTLLICLFIGVFIYRWSKELFGEMAGLFSLFLFVFCPNLNGHSILFASDTYTALFTLSTFYYFWKFLKQPSNKNFFFFSLSFGVAQIIKYSLIHFIIFFAFVSLFILIKHKTLFSRWRKNFARLLVFTTIVLLTINTAYLFNGTGKRLENYEFKSTAFTSIQSIPVISKIPEPLPVPYIEGLDITQHMNELGAGDPNVSGMNYMLGNYRSGHGFWSYYLTIFLFKTPIPYLLALILMLSLLISKPGIFDGAAKGLILGGVIYFFLFFSLFNNVQIGIRHILLIYPLLYVLMGSIVKMQLPKKAWLAVATFFILYTLISFYYYFPNLISYTNELIADKKRAYKIMADTNLDYGQGNFALAKYLEKHTDVKIASSVPQMGKFVLSVNDYVDINGTGRFRWLRKFTPVRHINHCYLLFDISADDLKAINMK